MMPPDFPPFGFRFNHGIRWGSSETVSESPPRLSIRDLPQIISVLIRSSFLHLRWERIHIGYGFSTQAAPRVAVAVCWPAAASRSLTAPSCPPVAKTS